MACGQDALGEDAGTKLDVIVMAANEQERQHGPHLPLARGAVVQLPAAYRAAEQHHLHDPTPETVAGLGAVGAPSRCHAARATRSASWWMTGTFSRNQM